MDLCVHRDVCHRKNTVHVCLWGSVLEPNRELLLRHFDGNSQQKSENRRVLRSDLSAQSIQLFDNPTSHKKDVPKPEEVQYEYIPFLLHMRQEVLLTRDKCKSRCSLCDAKTPSVLRKSTWACRTVVLRRVLASIFRHSIDTFLNHRQSMLYLDLVLNKIRMDLFCRNNRLER